MANIRLDQSSRAELNEHQADVKHAEVVTPSLSTAAVSESLCTRLTSNHCSHRFKCSGRT